ncbi:MAG: helix-turn-helix transcriptional regulator [Eubacteriales bacterium]|nr:helix-turn-helix transcriptional regulator [Eubacteriales bacterium]
MDINERLFKVMKDNGISIRELARRTGITASTISDWNTKHTNPTAEKIPVVCEALGITVSYLLKGTEETDFVLSDDERNLVETFRNADEESQNRLLAYFKQMSKKKEG